MGLTGIASVRIALTAGFVLLLVLPYRTLCAQDNYEIQVYRSETMAPGVFLTELHSNYTVEASTTGQYGLAATRGQEHDTA